MTKLYLTPKQKRLLLELGAESGTRYYDIDHMSREEAAKRIDYHLSRRWKGEIKHGHDVRR
jgi:hypothetical protein